MLTTFLNKVNKYYCDSSVNSAQMKTSTFEANLVEKPRKKVVRLLRVFCERRKDCCHTKATTDMNI